MPRPNRVSPMSELFADPARGLFMGNRGILHDAQGRIGNRRWTTKAWICCVLSFKDRQRPIMQPGHYTELFFLDEAVAYAAGHRPCAECRRADYLRFKAIWQEVHGAAATVAEIDLYLHAARIDASTRQQRTYPAPDWHTLPDGSFVRPPTSDRSFLVWRARLLEWRPAGYLPVPDALAPTAIDVLTPAPIVALFAAGLRPYVHHSAEAVI